LELQKAGASYLFITDSAFNADYEHSLAVAHAFKKAGLAIPWGAFLSPTKPPEGFYTELAKAGMTHAEFGTEALSNRMLAAYRKPFDVRNIFNSHRAAVEAGLYTAHYFLLGGPGENTDTVNETLEQVDKLDKTVLFFFCGVRIYPHTELYDRAVAEGQISPGMNLLEPVFYRSTGINDGEILRRVTEKAAGRKNWVIGSGGEETSQIVSRLHERGFSGPLWEYLIR
jgi:radical SAM superfamily enzyme YgiQ (UPF0313 family)